MMWATLNIAVLLIFPVLVHSDSRFTALEIDNFPCRAKNLKKTTRYVCDASGKVTCMAGWMKDPHEDKNNPCSKPVCSPACVNGDCIGPNICACYVGWAGKNCTECIPFPGCDHGRCVNEPLTCICDRGYRGKICNRPICNNCVNGQCTRPNKCTCYPGWSGENCTVCQDLPGCRNGNCTNSRGMQVGNGCFCQPGWKGALCDQPVCDRGCVNGECRSINNEPVCVCNKGWRGMNCSDCIPHPGCPGSCRTPWGCICERSSITDICMELSDCGCNVAGTINPGLCTVDGNCTCRSRFFGQKCETIRVAPTDNRKKLGGASGMVMPGTPIHFRIECQGPCRDITIGAISASGNPELFINLNEQVNLVGTTCTNTCSCQLTNPGLTETCPTLDMISQSTFFVAVAAGGGQTITGGYLTIMGANVQSCTEILPTG